MAVNCLIFFMIEINVFVLLWQRLDGGMFIMIWAYLIHLGYNMWAEEDGLFNTEYTKAKSVLRLDKSLWDDIIKKLYENDFNTLIIDLGEGIKYQSHPELAVEGSWSIDELKKELVKIRSMGINPIPKLNFSACHDEWLGIYSRMVSTPKYYEVCSDLINEVIDIFDNPEYFHLGMDEETYEHQKDYNYAVVRNPKLWWHDLKFLIDTVEKNNVTAWIWSDVIWHYPDEFLKEMPKTVVQNNWYYEKDFNSGITAVDAYDKLAKNGFKQIPTASNWSCCESFINTVKYFKDNHNDENLLGFMQTAWKPTIEERRYRHFDAIELAGQGKKYWEKE